ncbi:MAG: F0F1 ATP synthase subunit epsilon, partial [Peptococcaceae bacterium]|nr:F0F1 ATP synthase subunit epsilon [Peptococcaceae bacterium]
TDIDFARAEAAKKRALERLAQKENIDMARAQAALARANARLSVR